MPKVGYKQKEEHKRKVAESVALFISEKRRRFGFVNSPETRRKISEANKKNPNRYWLGKKRPPFSEERRRRMSETHKGKVLSQETREKISKNNSMHSPEIRRKVSVALRGRIMSEETRKKMSEARRGKRTGENSPSWKGGISKTNVRIRNSAEYRNWRREVFRRDDYSCVLCFRKRITLNADHYPKMFKEILKEERIVSLEQAMKCTKLWDVNIGRTLCKECHHRITWGK